MMRPSYDAKSSNYDAKSYELITMKFVILACMCVCRPIARRRASSLSYILVLRVNLLGFTRKSTWFDPS